MSQRHTSQASQASQASHQSPHHMASQVPNMSQPSSSPASQLFSPFSSQQASQQAPASASAKRTAMASGDSDELSAKKSKGRATDRGGKGLRHFSMCVCQKVQEKGVTTYAEVAEELVAEQQVSGPTDTRESRNIKRRVYDALNVLTAMNIISKEKKEIRWLGLPTNTQQEFKQYEELKAKKLDAIKRTKDQLRDLILQQIAFKNLIKRNEERQRSGLLPDSSEAVKLPFILVNTPKDTTVDCQISDDRTEYYFGFDKPFEIHDDFEVLKRMNMAFGIERGACTDQQLKQAKDMIPSALAPYLDELVEAARQSAPPATASAPASITTPSAAS
eukprot:m.108466 g.108466  ORF g.108466 m.108466 type:complete len:332 (+) comp13347_c0_seq1:160-1155(+)